MKNHLIRHVKTNLKQQVPLFFFKGLAAVVGCVLEVLQRQTDELWPFGVIDVFVFFVFFPDLVTLSVHLNRIQSNFIFDADKSIVVHNEFFDQIIFRENGLDLLRSSQKSVDLKFLGFGDSFTIIYS